MDFFFFSQNLTQMILMGSLSSESLLGPLEDKAGISLEHPPIFPKLECHQQG